MQLLLDSIVPPIEVKRWTLDEYHRMIKDGYLDEDDEVELLEGWIVPKMPRNPSHDESIDAVHYALIDLLPRNWRIRIQSALTVDVAASEPEPDLLVCAHPLGQRRRHPIPAETPLVIEVADSSLSRDRSLKSRIYARAKIPIYWIVNLPDRQIEVYTNPSGPTKSPKYRGKRFFRNGAIVLVAIDGKEFGSIAASSLLPVE